MEKSIEIDCAPGGLRPGDLITGVVKGTVLESMPEAQPTASVSRLFGNWCWTFPAISDEAWIAIQPVLRGRLTKLYQMGQIRYASW